MKITTEALVNRSQELIHEYTGKEITQSSHVHDDDWFVLLAAELGEILHNPDLHINRHEIQQLIDALNYYICSTE